MESKQSERSLLFPVLTVNFIGTLGFSIVLPFLVVIVLKLGGNEIAYGLLGATYSFFQLIGAPILGAWSDTYGRRKILLLSLSGTFLAWLIFLAGLLLPQTNIRLPFTQSLSISLPLLLIFVARATDGITGGNVSVANAYLADISTPANRKQNFGKMSSASNFGLICGPLIAGLLGSTALGNILPIIATIGVSFLAVLIIYFKLRDVRPVKQSDPVNHTQKLFSQQHKDIDHNTTIKKANFFLTLKIRYVTFFLILYFFIFLAFNVFYVSFPVYVAGKLKWTVFELGVFFAVMSGLLIFVQGPVLSWLAKKISSAKLIIAGAASLCVAFIFFTYAGTFMIYTGVAFFAIGNGLMWPSFIAMLSGLGDENNQGAIQGFASSSGSLASIIGLIAGAFLYHRFEQNVFLLASALMLLIGLVSIKLISIEKEIN